MRAPRLHHISLAYAHSSGGRGGQCNFACFSKRRHQRFGCSEIHERPFHYNRCVVLTNVFEQGTRHPELLKKNKSWHNFLNVVIGRVANRNRKA